MKAEHEIQEAELRESIKELRDVLESKESCIRELEQRDKRSEEEVELTVRRAVAEETQKWEKREERLVGQLEELQRISSVRSTTREQQQPYEDSRVPDLR